MAPILVKEVKKAQDWPSGTRWSVTKSFLYCLCDKSGSQIQQFRQSNSNQPHPAGSILTFWFSWMMTSSRQDLLQWLEASVAFQRVSQSLGTLHPYSVSTKTETMTQSVTIKYSTCMVECNSASSERDIQKVSLDSHWIRWEICVNKDIDDFFQIRYFSYLAITSKFKSFLKCIHHVMWDSPLQKEPPCACQLSNVHHIF